MYGRLEFGHWIFNWFEPVASSALCRLLLPARQQRDDDLPRAALWRFGIGFSRVVSHWFFSLIFYENSLGPITASFMHIFVGINIDNSSKTTDLSHIVLVAMAAGA